MTIEAQIEKLTAALEANTTAQNANTVALVKITNAAAATVKGASAKTEAKPEAKATDAPKTDAPKKAPPKQNKKATVSVDDVVAAFTTYRDNGPGEKTDRLVNMRAINNHYGVTKISEIAAENYAGALAYLKQFEDGEKPDFMNEPEAEEAEAESLV